MNEQQLTYASAGVSFEASEESLKRIKPLLKRTHRPGVMGGFGSFGGLFALDLTRYGEPVLVSSTDSVGTKLKIAFMAGKHDTVGYDLVAHCGNDIVVQGAEPLYFLDYLGISKLVPETFEAIVKGLTDGCKEIGCALLGGETAELPGFYAPGEYDLVGFVVGVVDKPSLITGDQIQPGDQLIGLGSVGLHTNGYSLARKILFEVCEHTVDSVIPGLGLTVAEEMLKPHKSYVRTVLTLQDKYPLHGIAHITGGGLPDNVIRILPGSLEARIELDSWDNLPIFDYLQTRGNVVSDEMYHVFNMGIGLVLATPADSVDAILSEAKALGEKAYHIGEITQGESRVVLS